MIELFLWLPLFIWSTFSSVGALLEKRHAAVEAEVNGFLMPIL